MLGLVWTAGPGLGSLFSPQSTSRNLFPKLGVSQVSCHQITLGRTFSLSLVVEGLLRNGVELGVRDVVVPWELEVLW